MLLQLDLAQMGIFTQPDKTPFESVMYADLYEAFTVLSALQAKENAKKNDHNTAK